MPPLLSLIMIIVRSVRKRRKQQNWDEQKSPRNDMISIAEPIRARARERGQNMKKKNEKDLDKEIRKMEKNAEKPAILFSFDGAIMNTENAVLATYRHVLAVYSNEAAMHLEENEDLARCDAAEIFAACLPGVDPKEAMREFGSYQRNHLIDLIQPMPGVRELLIWLKKENYKVGIVSARERSSVVEYLRHTDIDPYIDVIIGKSGYGETRTDAILTACHLMHATSCVFITDSARNLQAGAAAGTFNIGFVTRPKRTEALVEAGADFLTRDYKEVHKLLCGEPLWLAYTLAYPEEMVRQREKQKKAEKKARKKEKAARKKTAASGKKENEEQKKGA